MMKLGSKRVYTDSFSVFMVALTDIVLLHTDIYQFTVVCTGLIFASLLVVPYFSKKFGSAGVVNALVFSHLDEAGKSQAEPS